MTLSAAHPWTRWIWVAVIMLVPLIGAMALLGGGIRHIHTHVIGLGGDPYQTLWRTEELWKALTRGSFSIADEPFRNLSPLPWIPLHAFFGEPLAINLVWLLQFPLAACATFWLGRVLGLPRGPAVLAGILVAFAPYRIAQSLGHFGAMQLWWIPAILASVVRWLKAPSVPRVLGPAALVVGAAWTEHTLALTAMLSVLVAFFALSPLVQQAAASPRGRVSGALGVFIVLFVGVAPFFGELRLVSRSETYLRPTADQRVRFAPRPAAFVTLAPFHPARASASPYGTSAATVADHVTALGAVTIVAGLAASVASWRAHRRTVLLLLAVTGVGVLLSMAPLLPALGALQSTIPVLSAVRAVGRFSALGVVTLPVLAAFAIVVLWRRSRTLAALIGLLLVLERLPAVPFPMQSATVPGIYEALREAPPGALLEVPAMTDYLVASRALWASTQHGRRVLGSSAFERVEGSDERERVLRIPVLRDLLLLRTDNLAQPTFFSQDPATIGAAALASENVTAVLLHQTALDRSVIPADVKDQRVIAADITRAAAFLEGIGFTERARADGDLLFIRTRDPFEDAPSLIALRGDGWERDAHRADGTLQALVRDAAFEVRVVGNDALEAQLTFRVASGSHPGSFTVENGTRRAHDAVTPGESVTIPLGVLTPGAHAFRLQVDGLGIIIENPTVVATKGSGF